MNRGHYFHLLKACGGNAVRGERNGFAWNDGNKLDHIQAMSSPWLLAPEWPGIDRLDNS